MCYFVTILIRRAWSGSVVGCLQCGRAAELDFWVRKASLEEGGSSSVSTTPEKSPWTKTWQELQSREWQTDGQLTGWNPAAASVQKTGSMRQGMYSHFVCHLYAKHHVLSPNQDRVTTHAAGLMEEFLLFHPRDFQMLVLSARAWLTIQVMCETWGFPVRLYIIAMENIVKMIERNIEKAVAPSILRSSVCQMKGSLPFVM